jgi:acyl carrier protein
VDSSFAIILRPFLKYAGSQEITADSPLRDLGLDSMRAIELLFAIEDEYAVSMPDELLVDKTFETAGALWSTITSLRPSSDQPR